MMPKKYESGQQTNKPEELHHMDDIGETGEIRAGDEKYLHIQSVRLEKISLFYIFTS